MTTPSDVLLAPATELARMVRDRELSAVELLDLHVARIEERNPELNAIVLPRIDEARGEARAADRAAAFGEPLGPLHGIPFTCKEAIAVAGMRWPNGSKLFADAVAGYDAPAIRRVRGAGAILLGKTNVPEFCAFYDTANDLFGATHNPHAHGRSAGGSSGGESAAVASGMSALGIGSDLSSSIRNPAHFTGLFGLKPSPEFGPCTGHAHEGETPLWSRLAVIGPLARSAGDLELALTVIAGHRLPSPRPVSGTVAVYETDSIQPIARDCRRAVRMAAQALADAGHELVEELPPQQQEIRARFNTIVGIELAAPLAPLVAGRESELSPYGRMAVELAVTDVSLAGYLEVWSELGALAREVEAWLERRQLVVCPVAPGPAPPVGEGFTEIDGQPARPGPKLTMCALANAVGLPAASVPVLRTDDGLPIGVQVIGGRGRDLEVIAAARTLEEAFGGFIAPPGPRMGSLRG